MAYGLPTRGQRDWDDEILNSIESLRGLSESATANAASASSAANAASAQAASAQTRADQAYTLVGAGPSGPIAIANVTNLQATLDGKAPTKNNVVSLTTPATDQAASFTIVDDGSGTGTWPNRLEMKFQPSGQSAALTGYFNEYGEIRAVPAKNNTVALRAFGKQFPGDATHTGPVIELQDNRTDRNSMFSVDATGAVVTAGAITRAVPSGPTLSTGYLVLTAAASVPANTPAGTLIVRTP